MRVFEMSFQIGAGWDRIEKFHREIIDGFWIDELGGRFRDDGKSCIHGL